VREEQEVGVSGLVALLGLTLASSNLLPAKSYAQTSFPARSLTDENIDESNTNSGNGELTISPYLWAPEIGGTVALGPINAPVDLSLSDLASGIKIGGMGHLQYDAGSAFVYLEGVGAKFGDPEFASFGNQPVAASAIMIESGVGTSFALPVSSGRQLHVSPYAGMRFLRLKASVNGPLGSIAGENNWVDPVAGAIIELEISDRWSLIGKADLAGMSLTDNTYKSGALMVQYRASTDLALIAGYRTASGNFRADDGLAANLAADGPVLGLRYSLGR